MIGKIRSISVALIYFAILFTAPVNRMMHLVGQKKLQ